MYRVSERGVRVVNAVLLWYKCQQYTRVLCKSMPPNIPNTPKIALISLIPFMPLIPVVPLIPWSPEPFAKTRIRIPLIPLPPPCLLLRLPLTYLNLPQPPLPSRYYQAITGITILRYNQKLTGDDIVEVNGGAGYQRIGYIGWNFSKFSGRSKSNRRRHRTDEGGQREMERSREGRRGEVRGRGGKSLT